MCISRIVVSLLGVLPLATTTSILIRLTIAISTNEKVFHRVADKSYRPMNQLLESCWLNTLDFSLSLSITGDFIEQAERWGARCPRFVLSDWR